MAKSVQKHPSQHTIPDGIFLESLKTIAIRTYFIDIASLFVISSLIPYQTYQENLYLLTICPKGKEILEDSLIVGLRDHSMTCFI